MEALFLPINFIGSISLSSPYDHIESVSKSHQIIGNQSIAVKCDNYIRTPSWVMKVCLGDFWVLEKKRWENTRWKILDWRLNNRRFSNKVYTLNWKQCVSIYSTLCFYFLERYAVNSSKFILVVHTGNYFVLLRHEKIHLNEARLNQKYAKVSLSTKPDFKLAKTTALAVIRQLSPGAVLEVIGG